MDTNRTTTQKNNTNWIVSWFGLGLLFCQNETKHRTFMPAVLLFLQQNKIPALLPPCLVLKLPPSWKAAGPAPCTEARPAACGHVPCQLTTPPPPAQTRETNYKMVSWGGCFVIVCGLWVATNHWFSSTCPSLLGTNQSGLARGDK